MGKTKDKFGVSEKTVYTARCKHCGRTEYVVFGEEKTYETIEDAEKWLKKHAAGCSHNPLCEPSCQTCVFAKQGTPYASSRDCGMHGIKNVSYNTCCKKYVYKLPDKEDE